MEEYIIIGLLENFKSVCERLQSIEIEDPFDYLKEVVNELMTKDDTKYAFDDCGQMFLFLKKINEIKAFFKEEKHKTLESISSYLTPINIPKIDDFADLAAKKRTADDKFNLIDVNEIVLNEANFQSILDVFSDFKADYSNFYIIKHNEINSLRGNFGESLITSSVFKLLSNLSSIDQIKLTLLNPPNRIKTDIQTIRNLKCLINKDELSKILEKRPECSNCNMNFEEIYDPVVLDLLATQHQQIEDKIYKSLFTTLETIHDKEDRINEILKHEKYRVMENLINFFNKIFNNITDEWEITSDFIDCLFELYSNEVLEIIREAFQEEPEIIIIDLIEDIVDVIESRIYTEEELMEEFQETIETVKDNKKQEIFNELGLAPDDDKPIIHFRFRKR